MQMIPQLFFFAEDYEVLLSYKNNILTELSTWCAKNKIIIINNDKTLVMNFKNNKQQSLTHEIITSYRN